MGNSIWSHEMAQALTRSEMSVARLIDAGQENSTEHAAQTKVSNRLRSAFRSAWKLPPTDIFTQ